MHKQKLDDSVLVSNYIDGNERSLEILILRHKQRIFSFIYSKVQNRDVADDIFQDTFIKVINTLKLGKYNEEGKFLPWTTLTHADLSKGMQSKVAFNFEIVTTSSTIINNHLE